MQQQHTFGVKLKNKEIQREGGDTFSYFQNVDISMASKKRYHNINLVHFSLHHHNELTGSKTSNNPTAQSDSV